MMNNLLDFLSAALPWIVMGAVLAVFFVREAKRKKGKKDHQKKKDDYGSEGMALDMCFGVAIATAMHRDVGLGLSLGMLLGLTVGSSMKKEDDDDEGSTQ